MVFVKSGYLAGRWWRTPLIPALGRQRQWISEFKASLVYKVSSRIARAIQRNTVSEKKKKKGSIWYRQGKEGIEEAAPEGERPFEKPRKSPHLFCFS
jgi:hypothetical protein